MNKLLTIALIILAALLPQSQAQSPGFQQWADRLEQLDPVQPMAYFELAEEIADRADSDEDRALARQVFALAGALDPQRLGRSAALAVADLEDKPQAKRRLLALASLLDIHGSGSVLHASQRSNTNETLEAISEILSLYRTGRGPQALTKIEESSARSVLKRHGNLLPGGFNQFLQDCRIYKANLRPTLTDGELARMLQLEQALLARDERSWSDEFALTGGAPLIEVDPQRMDESLGVDASRSVYRNGSWQPPNWP